MPFSRAVLPMACLLLLTAFGPAATAQTTANISGTVRDQSGGVMPGVTVTVTNTSTNLVRSNVSGAEGRYAIPSLPPGRYELRAELLGFKSHLQRDLALTVGESLAINITLQVGTLEEVVDIAPNTPVINTSTSELSYLVGSDAIEQLPLNGRNYTDLALLQPGVLAYPHRDGGSVVAHGARNQRQRAGPAIQRVSARRHAAERLHQRAGRQRRRHVARHRDDP